MLRKFAEAQVLEARDHTEPAMRLRKGAHRASFDYEPREGYIYVRSRAISSRCNDNFDEFPAEEIKQAYRTFIGKPVFVNHHNEDHRKARGVIIDATLHEDANPDGSPDVWAEVLMEVDAKRYPKLAEAILKGHIDRTSMGTDVEYSLCSFCGNKASTPLDYCRHIPAMKGQKARRVTASGNVEEVLIREICYGLKFFENSLLVEEPADPTAHFLDVDDRGLQAAAARRRRAAHDPNEAGGWHARERGFEMYMQGKELVRPPDADDDYWQAMQEGYSEAQDFERHGPQGRHARRRHAYGETKAPRDVDTLRDGECPVCGDDETFDGENCRVCGYTAPPKEFQDPDLDKAKEMDLRQQQPNGEDPENPTSTSPEEQVEEGEEVPPEGDKPVEEMAPEEALEATSPQDEALLKEVNDVLTEVKKMVSPSGGDVHDEVRQQLDELREVMESGAEVEPPVDEEAPEDEEDEEDGSEDEGDEESEDDDLPDFMTKDDEDKDKKKSSKTAEQFVEGDKAWLTNWNGAQAPVTIVADPAPGTPGDGWVQVLNEESGNEYPAKRDQLSRMAARVPARPVPGTARPPQGVRRDVSEEKRMSGNKSGLKALAEATTLLKQQAQTIESLQRRTARLERSQSQLLALAGVGQREADADNPAQPVEDKASEAPAVTTEEARAPDGTDDVENEGSSSVSDVGPDQTTDVTAPGGVVDEPLDLNEQDVEAPVDGTTEQRPLNETRTETDVRIDTPHDNSDKNRDGGFLGNLDEHRLIASMRLAKLRLAHDIVDEGDPRDDLALGDRIAKSDMSDEDIAHEVRTLERVTESSKKRAGRKQPERRDLVPRVASGNGDGGNESAPTKRTPSFAGSSPSVSAERTVPSAAVEDEEFLFD